MKTTVISILALILSGAPLYAFEQNDSIRILFRQGHAEIDSTIQGNASSLSRLDSIFSKDGTKLKKIEIIGTASPEGGVSLNNHLSDNRAENILRRIKGESDIDSSEIQILYTGRDWVRLLEFTQADPNVPFKEETIALLSEINKELAEENGEKESNHFLNRLKSLRNGVPYQYLYKNIFPSLRTSRVFFSYYTLPPVLPDLEGPGLLIENIYPNPEIEMPEIPSYFVKPKKKFYMALKTNMLYDILALPSLSAEFYLGKNFSAVANWTYGWWDTDRTHHYWRAYGGDLAVRWWFGKKAMEKPLTGHHIGIYGGILTYDFEFGGTGYMGGLPHETLWNRSLRMAGVEYGYSQPIGKRLNIDFTIGIGYLGGKYIKYIPDNGRYLWQSTHKINWFGPTKAEVSLVWLIGPGNYNVK